MAEFSFSTAGQIRFGNGAVGTVPQSAATLGRRALVVRGAAPSRSTPLVSALVAQGLECIPFTVAREPTTETVTAGTQAARQAGCDLVIGIGGGSVLDAAKAIAALAANGGEALDYLEVVGKGKPITHPPLPTIAIPTTAGTGTEVTRNVVLVSPAHGVKASMRSPLLLARLAVVDPELTADCPPQVTAAAGMDALTQLIEPFLSINANLITDALARQGILQVARSLLRAYRDGRDADAREGMSLASLLSGMCLANAGLGVVHGIAAPLGGMLGAPHGAVCARLLPSVMKVNLRAMQSRTPQSPAVRKAEEIARILTGRPEATALQGVEWIITLSETLSIPRLATYGLTRDQIPPLVQKAMVASSTRGNPVALEPRELEEAIDDAL